MTELLYQTNSYLKDFDATVTEVKDGVIVLDRTAFYPGGGGQPADQGVLIWSGTEHAVTKLKKHGSDILHWIGGQLPATNTKIIGKIDWDHRYKLMRTHTALHILCGVIWRDFGASVTGGDMKPGKARMDFELESMSADFAQKVEESVNKEVEAASAIQIKILPREEAFQIPDLIRTKINLLPAGIQEVRTVNIVGLDLQADGGTHVANTKEVGKIKVVGHESKGKINKRLRIELE